MGTLVLLRTIGQSFNVTSPPLLAWLVAGYSLTVGRNLDLVFRTARRCVRIQEDVYSGPQLVLSLVPRRRAECLFKL